MSVEVAAAPTVTRARTPARAPRRWPWARLCRRVFAIEVLVCPRCAGPRRIVGTVTDPEAVRRLLGALGLAAQLPPHCSVTAGALPVYARAAAPGVRSPSAAG